MGTIHLGALRSGLRCELRSRAALRLIFVIAAFLSLSACYDLRLLDTTPLDRAGMSYDAIKELKALHVSQAEIIEIAKVRNSGLSDVDCVTILRVFHQRNEPFISGDAIAGLYQSGMSEGAVLGLATLDQVGVGAGELQAIHLAGLPDELVLNVARDRAAGKSTLSGAALGTMKNLHMDNATLLELVRRGTPEPDGPRIIAQRRQGAKDAEILHHFPATVSN
jgi:hypothetical protein